MQTAKVCLHAAAPGVLHRTHGTMLPSCDSMLPKLLQVLL